ncbi:MAG: hypothetical protein KGI71_05670 [Patescibacteria group bacterium]|nr:hypothetical protein [Patescibacteria group bacterium]
MNVLVACEFSGIVREAFRRRGHDAWSCDLRNNEDESDFHIIGDALEITRHLPWDLMIAHPPCTYLSRAGARWWRDPERQRKADEAELFVRGLWNAPISMIAIENPIGQLNRRWRYPDQIIQPWEYGHKFSKATCLWLKNLPPLMPTHICLEYTPLLPSNVGRGRSVGQRWSAGSVRDPIAASRTFAGIADAMAEQWGGAGAERTAA